MPSFLCTTGYFQYTRKTDHIKQIATFMISDATASLSSVSAMELTSKDSNEPLYVVDGIVREGGLSGLNTDDIKSIQV